MDEPINGHDFIFVIDQTRESSKHACSTNDIEKIIEQNCTFWLWQLKLIILRQPKRKEEILSPVWGRFVY